MVDTRPSLVKELPRRWMLKCYAALKSDEDTFKWLQAAYRDRAVRMEYLAVDPIFDRYRSGHRFQEPLRRIDLL
jgi:hypothetical protein